MTDAIESYITVVDQNSFVTSFYILSFQNTVEADFGKSML